MTVLSCNLVDRKASLGADGQKKSVRVYQVATDDAANDDEIVVLDYAGLPAKYASHPSDDSMWVDTLDAEPFEDRLHWRVTVNYVPKPGGNSQDVGGVNHPTDLPAIVSFFTDFEKVAMKNAYDLTVDGYGSPSLPIVNSAKDPFQEPAEVDNPRLGIRIVRNERDEDVGPQLFASFIGGTNDGAVRVAGIDIAHLHGKMRDIRMEPQRDALKDLYWQVTYEIVIDEIKSWQYWVLDQGFNKRDPATGARTEISPAGTGKRATVAVLLDGLGQPKADGGKAHYEKFTLLWPSDWEPLKLPKTREGR